MKFKVIVLLLIAQLGFSQQTSLKNPGDFDTVKVFDKISVQLVPSEENKVQITGKYNSDVEIVNNNGVLKIKMSFGKLIKGEDISVVLYFKKIETIEAAEGSFIFCEAPFRQISLRVNSKSGASIKLQLDVQKATISASSGGIVQLEGTAENQEASISTGGILQADNLDTTQTTVSVTTGGVANVRASDLVDAKVKAGGNITIYGKPNQINQKTILGGTIVESDR